MSKLQELMSTPRSNVVPSIIQFPATDIEGMSKRLKLKERAHEQGSQNLPVAESEGFDPAELAVTSEISRMAKDQFDLYLEQQKVYAERAADTSVRSLALKIRSTAQDAITNMERETHIGTGELYAKKREVIQTENALKDFKIDHGLKRPPRSYSSKAVQISILLLLLAMEGILNGMFLAKGSEFGQIGGILFALLFAGINITIAVLTGRFILPWLGYRNMGVRFLFAVLLCVYVAAALLFNLAVAHYRTAMMGDPFEASIIAAQQIWNAPFAIADLNSWFLFLMGCLFSLVALADGWWMDDPYPGYGRVMRHNLQALDNYNSLKDALFGHLDDLKKSAEDQIDDITRSIGSRQGEFNNILMRSEALKATMQEHFEHLQSAANHLLTTYRNENQKHRTNPSPARFTDGRIWTLSRPSAEHDVVTSIGRDNFESALSDAFRDIPGQRDALHATYRASLNEYAKVDALVVIKEDAQ